VQAKDIATILSINLHSTLYEEQLQFYFVPRRRVQNTSISIMYLRMYVCMSARIIISKKIKKHTFKVEKHDIFCTCSLWLRGSVLL